MNTHSKRPSKRAREASWVTILRQPCFSDYLYILCIDIFQIVETKLIEFLLQLDDSEYALQAALNARKSSKLGHCPKAALLYIPYIDIFIYIFQT